MHIPVLQKEVLQYLNPKPNENFIDCTIGEGGHSAAILERNKPKGKVLGIEIDPEILKNTKYEIPACQRLERRRVAGRQDTKYKNRVILVCDSFVNLKEIVKREKFQKVNGILFDLGMSSWHLEKSGRGFSFLRNEPLDMRYNSETRAQNNFVLGRAHKICAPNPLTAEKILNFWSQIEIEKVLREYGQEKFSRPIAKNIIDFRQVKPIKTTFQLVEIIKESIPKRFQHQKIHPATRTFQALRIAVNNELNNLESALPQALEVLSKGGRLVVISFHSLEDRIVKNFFRGKQKDSNPPTTLPQKRAPNLIKILTKKPIRPSNQEIRLNSRSRSAKLRACQKF